MPHPTVDSLPISAGIEAWVLSIEKRPYFQRLAEIARARKEGHIRLPRFLYRFHSLRRTPGRKPDEPVFLEESVDRLRTVMVRSLLALRSPEEFNDPFDMGATFDITGTDTEKRARLRALFRKQNPKGKLSQREDFVARMLAMPPETLLSNLKASYRRSRRDFGIICFVGGREKTTDTPMWSRDAPRDVLMWSHYGAEHAGVCLQFDPANDIRALHRALHIEYVETYPVLTWVKNFETSIGKSLLRKHPRWAYEREFRISLPDQAGKYLPFKPDALTGIILGCRAGGEVEKVVFQLLAERTEANLPALRVFRARQNEARYDLEIESVAASWLWEPHGAD